MVRTDEDVSSGAKEPARKPSLFRRVWGRRLLMHLLFWLVFVPVIIAGWLLYLNTHFPRMRVIVTAQGLSFMGLPAQEVSFDTVDGVRLVGWLVAEEGPAPAIVLCHGLGANREDLTDMIRFLHEAGFAVLGFDFRAHGESGGSTTSLGYKEQWDLRAAVDFVTSRPEIDPDRIGAYGLSMGAAAVICSAAGDDRIRAVVAESCYRDLAHSMGVHAWQAYHLPRWPLVHLASVLYRLSFGVWPQDVSPAKAIVRLAPRPVLIINAEGDHRMSTADAKLLYSRAEEPKTLWLVPGTGHGGCFSAQPEEYPRRITSFFQEALGGEKPGRQWR